MRLSRCILYSAITALLLLNGGPAWANMGLPMLAAVWPAAYLLLVPIIILEAAVAQNVIHVSFGSAIQIAAVGNVVSTVLGMPVCWLILVVVQVVTNNCGAYGLNTLRGRILSVTLQSPWILPYRGEEYWMVPAAELTLCIPFCLMSVWSEYLSVCLFLRNQVPLKELLRWAWTANLISYSIIVCSLLIYLAWRIWSRLQEQKKITNYPPLRLVEDNDVERNSSD